MTSRLQPHELVKALPLVVLFTAAAVPLLFVAAHVTALSSVDASSLPSALLFAIIGSSIAALVGGTVGAIVGTLEVPARRVAIAMSVAMLAAPPAFWWIGVTRLPVGVGSLSGPVSGSLVAGLGLTPITFLLVLAAAREIPSNVYEAARASLGPMRRVVVILLPLVRPALLAGFVLTMILLLGESEIPFLFGFRTSMTDVVTTFSQTFDAGRTVPVILPLLATVLALGVLLAKPLFAVMMPGRGSGRGIIRKPCGLALAAPVAVLPLMASCSLAGYAWAAASGGAAMWHRLPLSASIVTQSIAEPVMSALAGVGLALLAAYPLRRSPAFQPLIVFGLLLFCVPAAVLAIGWIGVAQRLDITVPPAAAHVSRTIGLPALGFLVAYSRLPQSLDDAARLVDMSPLGRAWRLVLPLLAPSLAATAALMAALMFADRDVPSLLLAPGESRLMLNLYLLSANAPSAVIGATALFVFAAGLTVIAIAAAIPFVLWSRSRA